MVKAKKLWPQFIPGARVMWLDGTARKYGTVKDIHKLGGHGHAYEIAQDHEALPEEITEAELARVLPKDDPTIRAILEALTKLDPSCPTVRLVLKTIRDHADLAVPREMADAQRAWIAAGCPGL